MIWYSVAASLYLLVGLVFAMWRMKTIKHWPEPVRRVAESSRACWLFVFAVNWLLWPLDVLMVLAYLAKVTIRHWPFLRAMLCGYWPQLHQAINVQYTWRNIRKALATVMDAHDFHCLEHEIRELAEQLQRKGLIPPDLAVTKESWPPVFEIQNHCVKCGRQPPQLILTPDGSMCGRCAPKPEPVDLLSPIPMACQSCGKPFDLPQLTEDSKVLCKECFKSRKSEQA